jgi:hypothetical protein
LEEGDGARGSLSSEKFPFPVILQLLHLYGFEDCRNAIFSAEFQLAIGNFPLIHKGEHLEHFLGLFFTFSAEAEGRASGGEAYIAVRFLPAHEEVVASVGTGSLAFFSQDKVGFRLAGETFHRFSVQLFQTPVRPLEGKFLLMVGNSVMQENGRASIQGYLRACRSSEQRFLAIEDGCFQRGVILKVGSEEADAES